MQRSFNKLNLTSRDSVPWVGKKSKHSGGKEGGGKNKEKSILRNPGLTGSCQGVKTFVN